MAMNSKLRVSPGRRIGRLGAAARAGHGVEVDIVHHHAVVVVLQPHLDGVADAHAHERARAPSD